MTIEKTPLDGVQIEIRSFEPRSRRDRTARAITGAIREMFAARPLSQMEETLLCLAVLGWEDSAIASSRNLAMSTIRSVWQRILDKTAGKTKRAIIGALIEIVVCGGSERGT
jgi:DNA-binding NarL/FixJ family response regulator